MNTNPMAALTLIGVEYRVTAVGIRKPGGQGDTAGTGVEAPMRARRIVFLTGMIRKPKCHLQGCLGGRMSRRPGKVNFREQAWSGPGLSSLR